MGDSHTPQRKTIVLVDDEPTTLRYLERTLRKGGHDDLIVTTNPHEALAKASEGHIRLLLLDLHMPDMDGFELLAALTTSRHGATLPVIVVTADDSPVSRQRALELGATDVITAPFHREELLLRVRNLLRRTDLHRQIAEANTILEQQVRLNARELQRAHAEMLVRLARAAEYRDDQTGEHTCRVGRITRMLAEKLSMPARTVDLMGLAARLHDVGKIGIPDHILLKRGRFTPDEYDLMKGHTTIGARLLAGGRSELIRMAERIAVSHHERWDGTGYPEGLAGEAIPVEGCIVAVADVFDALTNVRSYKDPWPEAEAVTEIGQQRGRQFRADVVDAFLELSTAGSLSNIAAHTDDDDEIARVMALP